MAENIIMPQLGESIAEGTIVKWLKEPGDAVKKDENLLLISTDKVEAEIPSPSAGVLLDILIGPGKTVAVGTVLGHVGAASESGEVKKAAPASERIEAKTPPKENGKDNVSREAAAEAATATRREDNGDMSSFLSPLVRRIAHEHGVSEREMDKISGSGRGGRVSKKDLLEYLETREEPRARSTERAPEPERNFAIEARSDASTFTTEKPISTMRRVIMENMLASRRTSAHVTTFFEIDYTAIDQVRARHKDQFQRDEQVSLTYTSFLAAAVCQVLKRHPYINASIGKESILFKKDIHLGIAVAIEQPEPGLMVPVIKNADKQNLRGLAHQIADLSSRVRARKIKPDELSGGTFTITNPGNYGALIGMPIINQPQVAILGVGNIKKQATVLEVNGTDVIAIRRMGLLSLSFDHRLVDGATADIFMQDLKKTLESWTSEP